MTVYVILASPTNSLSSIPVSSTYVTLSITYLPITCIHITCFIYLSTYYHLYLPLYPSSACLPSLYLFVIYLHIS